MFSPLQLKINPSARLLDVKADVSRCGVIIVLTLIASFFLPSHLSFKNMYMIIHCYIQYHPSYLSPPPRRSDLPTVVAIPPDTTGLIPDRSYTYSVFPSLNPTLLSSRCGSKMNRSPSVCSLLSGSAMVARRTRAEKHRDKLVGHR